MTTYKTLTLKPPRESYPIKRSTSGLSSKKHHGPALALMTDLEGKTPVTIAANTAIDTALEHMISAGVRLLFVVDADDNLLGSVTSYEIQGEKPMLYMQSQDCRIGICSRADIEVRDIMTPIARWKTVRHEDLTDVSVDDIAGTIQGLGQHHLIVVDPLPEQDLAIVRGIFSLTDLERALGKTFTVNETAESFFEIERALNT